MYLTNIRNQQIGESIDQYITDLKTKAQTCEFENLRDSSIRYRIVCGIICDKTRARLLREPNLSLERPIDICRANKATIAQLKRLGTNVTTKELTEIQAIQRKLNEDKTGNCLANGVEADTHVSFSQHKVLNATGVGEEITLPKFVIPSLKINLGQEYMKLSKTRLMTCLLGYFKSRNLNQWTGK